MSAAEFSLLALLWLAVALFVVVLLVLSRAGIKWLQSVVLTWLYDEEDEWL